MAQRKKPKDSAASPHHSSPEIPESEQWRIIKDSGVLDRDPIQTSRHHEDTEQMDEIFNAVLFIIPFSFLYLMMDILIQGQYGRHPTPREYAGRLGSSIPVLSLFIFYVLKYKTRRTTQFGLLATSFAVGTRLIWIVNRAPWHIITRQGPPLATLWIFTVAVLDLLPAVLGLGLVAGWVWWYKMKLVF